LIAREIDSLSLKAFVAKVREISPGDPETMLGPMIDEASRVIGEKGFSHAPSAKGRLH
jgi:hypothetical protein